MRCGLRNQTERSHTNMKKKEPGIAPCKVIKPVLDSGFYGVDSRFKVAYCGFLVSGTCIQDSKAQDSGFHKQAFHSLESGFPYMGRLHGSLDLGS